MTRGARPIDAINEGKVEFKRGAEKFGTTLTFGCVRPPLSTRRCSRQHRSVAAVAGA